MGIEKQIKRGSKRSKEVKVVKGSVLGQTFDVVRIQAEGSAGGGKSHFLLSIIRHMHEVMGIPLEHIKVCLIDCDTHGIAPLLFAQVIPFEYQDCIEYTKCETIFEAYDALKLHEESLAKHEKETGVKGWLMVENMGKVWYFCQRDYVEAAYHVDYVQMLIERQEEAHARGKKTLPALDQMLDYRNINPLHNEFANKITRGAYNLIWTTHTTTRKFQEGDMDVDKVVGAGQKDNDTRVDFIIRLYTLKSQFLCDTRKLRSLEHNLNRFKLPSLAFTAIVEKYYDMLRKDCRKRGVKVPAFYWMTKAKKQTETVKPATKKSDKPKPPVVEDDDDEEIELGEI